MWRVIIRRRAARRRWPICLWLKGPYLKINHGQQSQPRWPKWPTVWTSCRQRVSVRVRSAQTSLWTSSFSSTSSVTARPVSNISCSYSSRCKVQRLPSQETYRSKSTKTMSTLMQWLTWSCSMGCARGTSKLSLWIFRLAVRVMSKGNMWIAWSSSSTALAYSQFKILKG